MFCIDFPVINRVIFLLIPSQSLLIHSSMSPLMREECMQHEAQPPVWMNAEIVLLCVIVPVILFYLSGKTRSAIVCNFSPCRSLRKRQYWSLDHCLRDIQSDKGWTSFLPVTMNPLTLVTEEDSESVCFTPNFSLSCSFSFLVGANCVQVLSIGFIF